MSSKDRERELRKQWEKEQQRRKEAERLQRKEKELLREKQKYEKKYKEDKKCFLTTACVEYYGLPDDCKELTILRHFRDQYMNSFDEGKEAIQEYYRIAPQIIKSMNVRNDRDVFYQSIYKDLISHSIELISQGKYQEAYIHYKSFVKRLEKQVL
ncbi:CFI-box-CTERM domain-containing protein [Laceyella putida]|uniref:CFI-box-CTERM domain-containing protein n=1 Tax=Laceyella putida TaxID=110101 RepID=A0ABW2RF54_9BACL